MSTTLKNIAAEIGENRIVPPEDVKGRLLSPLGQTAPATYLLRPRSTQELGTILRLCHAAGQPVVTVGGATGLAGGLKLEQGEWLISLEAMRGIEVDAENRIAIVEAGAPLEAVHAAAENAGLSLPIDLGARGSAQIGGLISTNAGGEKALRFGMMRDQVLGLEVVLADGRTLDMMNRMIKNNTGYDLKHLFIGAEGTLGIVTRAVLRLRPALPQQHTGFVALPGFDAALAFRAAIEAAVGNDLTAFEVMWPGFYDVVAAAHTGIPPVRSGAGIYVIFEVEAGASTNAEAFIDQMIPVVEAGIADDIALAKSVGERNAMWSMRNNIEALIHAFMPPVAYDISVPTAKMGRFVETIDGAVAGTWPAGRMTAFGHMGDNNLHLAVTLGPETPALKHDLDLLIYTEVQRLGGSISAEHGLGADKRDHLHFSRNPGEIEAMRQLKSLFDPAQILNRGKVLPGQGDVAAQR